MPFQGMGFLKLTTLGEGPRGIKFQQTGIDDLKQPATLNKTVAAAGLKSYFANERLSNSLFVKYFSSHAKGFEMPAITTYGQEYDHRASRIGAGEALKYSFGRHLFARLSGESAVHLPEQEEFFGNGDFILSNFALTPERSYNFNLGIHAEKPELFSTECNLFYRRTYDMILLISTRLFAQYKNVDKVKGVGLGLWGKPKVNVASQIIPDQQMHTVGCTWQSPDGIFALSMEVKNIFDAEVFDNYRIQNAGRSFHVKINVHL